MVRQGSNQVHYGGAKWGVITMEGLREEFRIFEQDRMNYIPSEWMLQQDWLDDVLQTDPIEGSKMLDNNMQVEAPQAGVLWEGARNDGILEGSLCDHKVRKCEGCGLRGCGEGRSCLAEGAQ
jgi:hypothetical protein